MCVFHSVFAFMSFLDFRGGLVRGSCLKEWTSAHLHRLPLNLAPAQSMPPLPLQHMGTVGWTVASAGDFYPDVSELSV